MGYSPFIQTLLLITKKSDIISVNISYRLELSLVFSFCILNITIYLCLVFRCFERMRTVREETPMIQLQFKFYRITIL
nr:MAG TPA: hypothetical protein [Caudoviricetes sp.]